MENKTVNFSIQDGKAFFAEEISVTSNPLRFVFGFKSITPRIDVRSQEALQMVVEHNTVLVDPWLAKQFSTLLSEHIMRYESQYGTIVEPPQAIQAREQMKHESTSTNSRPGYFG